MRVLLLGSGGREHALSWKIAQSSALEELFIAPGNAGTRQFGKNCAIGPEEPLVRGIHDFFLADDLLKSVPVIGPNKHAAQLEGSKDFAK